MIVLDLITAAQLASQTAKLLVSAPSDPVLNAILSLATVLDTFDGGTTFTIRLAAISTVFRIRCPCNSELSERLMYSNIIGVDVSMPGITQFLIDT
jgi:hypothetical protein